MLGIWEAGLQHGEGCLGGLNRSFTPKTWRHEKESKPRHTWIDSLFNRYKLKPQSNENRSKEHMNKQAKSPKNKVFNYIWKSKKVSKSLITLNLINILKAFESVLNFPSPLRDLWPTLRHRAWPSLRRPSRRSSSTSSPAAKQNGNEMKRKKRKGNEEKEGVGGTSKKWSRRRGQRWFCDLERKKTIISTLQGNLSFL